MSSVENLETLSIRKFQDEIFGWWKNHKRLFPWRETTNPYHILISEKMLQQTQAIRVVPKYLEFIKEFNDMSDLGMASNAKILKLWSGLGYNKRALWLKEITKSIGNINNFPELPHELRNYKGIGKYTSNSILIFAFNQNLCAVDINIKKTLLHFDFINTNTKENQIYEICNLLLPHGRSRDWHNALMDFGALNLKNFRIGSKSKIKPFKGSIRQIRGKVIKLLTQIDNLNFIQIEEEIPHVNLKQILNDLEKDGLIVYQNDVYHL